MNRQLVRISKFLSLVLRHKPEMIGLTLDRGGWVQIDELLLTVNRAGVPLNQDVLRQVVEQDGKRRYSLSENGRRIKANYGHSIPVDLGLEPLAPPEFLFHGTATRFLEAIRAEGLVPRGRNYVHLSPDESTAVTVGQRHGKPIILTIQARRMHENGHRFHRSTGGVWLTKEVSVEYIQFLEH